MMENTNQREPNSHNEHSYIDVDSQKYKGVECLKDEINIPLVLTRLLIDHSPFIYHFQNVFRWLTVFKPLRINTNQHNKTHDHIGFLHFFNHSVIAVRSALHSGVFQHKRMRSVPRNLLVCLFKEILTLTITTVYVAGFTNRVKGQTMSRYRALSNVTEH